jgi:hypothetical protein
MWIFLVTSYLKFSNLWHFSRLYLHLSFITLPILPCLVVQTRLCPFYPSMYIIKPCPCINLFSVRLGPKPCRLRQLDIHLYDLFGLWRCDLYCICIYFSICVVTQCNNVLSRIIQLKCTLITINYSLHIITSTK